jgi:hypothetical protein
VYLVWQKIHLHWRRVKDENVSDLVNGLACLCAILVKIVPASVATLKEDDFAATKSRM